MLIALSTGDASRHRRWNLIEVASPGDQGDTLRPRIILIWVADIYRHRGVGAALVQAIVDDFGGHVADVSWSAPISSPGRRLARRLSSKGIWIS
ncbi:hypothetical protein VT50_0207170 [Streptomyces antioxidans]|uniref:N-acetyltransferase domain-containing protein n=1 Tax=Streptomyces antioxidans TaxID=1507734 RepID=A0A1V4D9E7_9ACTN|nr:hypothetical protein [Streptomyces antioxidans]OPF82339.1 hypothetical protein VT50_0207170 [Streptomyces antioxidans]